VLGGEFVIGETVTGCYTFERNTPASTLTATFAQYLGATRKFTFGSFVFGSSGSPLDQIAIYDDHPGVGDFYTAQVRNDRGTPGVPEDDVSFVIGGSGSTNLDAITTLVITELPRLNKYEPDPLEIFFQIGRSGVQATLERIRPGRRVPEPATSLLVGLAVVLLVVWQFPLKRSRALGTSTGQSSTGMRDTGGTLRGKSRQKVGSNRNS